MRPLQQQRPAAKPSRAAFVRTLGLLTVACAGLAGSCDRSEPGDERGLPDRPVRVALLAAGEFLPEWPAIRGGAERFAARDPMIVLTAEAVQTDRVEAVRAAVDGLLAANPEILCVYSRNPRQMAQVLRQAVQTPLGIISIGEEFKHRYRVGAINLRLAAAAGDLGAELDTLAPQAASFVLLHDAARSPDAASAHDRFVHEATKHLRMLTEAGAERGKPAARRLVAQMLEDFPNTRLVVTLLADPWLRGTTAEMLPPHTHYICLDSLPELWADLESGRALALYGPLHGELGYQAIALAREKALDKEIRFLQREVDMELIRRDDLGDYARRYAAAAGFTVEQLRRGGLTTAPGER